MLLKRQWLWSAGLLSLLMAAILLFPAATLAQEADQQQESSSKPPSADRQGQTDDPDSEADDSSGADTTRTGRIPSPVAPPIRQLGRAGSLARRFRGPISLGPLYVSSAQYLAVYDRFDFSGSGAPTLASDDLLTHIMQLNVVADHEFRRSRVAFQYQPRITVREGEVIKDLYNQHLNFDTYYMVSRNWTIGLGDLFTYMGNRDLAVDTFFSADGISGNILQNNFLDSPSRLISNEVHAGLYYQASQRTRLSFLPSFTYVYNSPRANFSSSTAHYYGFSAALDHIISPRTSVGVYYSSQYARFLQQDFQDALFQTVGVRLARELSQGWRIHGSVGGSTATDFSGRPLRTTVTGDVGIMRVFRRSTLGLAYNRGFEFAGFLTNGYHDRADAEFTTQLTRRLFPSFSAGYFREDSSPFRTRGTYASARLRYRLFGGVSWLVSYVFRDQRGDGAQVSNGMRQSVVTGLQWVPGGDRIGR